MPARLPGEPAELGPRFLARVVDGVVIALVAWPLLVSFGILASAAIERPPEAVVGGLTVGLLGFVYVSLLDAFGGTLGKRLFKLRVVGPAGAAPGLGAGTARNLWVLTSLLPTAIGQVVAVAVSVTVAVTIARDPHELGWHDRLAGTAVRRVPVADVRT